jgi:3-hydroxyacyl-[acyl-carrier-protein] dehydratase
MQSLNCIEIQKLIPHRYPFLLVDRIEQIDGVESAVGIKNVTINEPFFPGHFPDFPIMPGVLIVEAMAQTAGAIVCHSASEEGVKKSVFFMSIEEAKFRKPVLPGQQLRMAVKRIQSRRNVWKFQGMAYVDDVLHAEAIFTAMITQEPA